MFAFQAPFIENPVLAVFPPVTDYEFLVGEMYRRSCDIGVGHARFEFDITAPRSSLWDDLDSVTLTIESPVSGVETINITGGVALAESTPGLFERQVTLDGFTQTSTFISFQHEFKLRGQYRIAVTFGVADGTSTTLPFSFRVNVGDGLSNRISGY